jgi:hypothetical protein
MAGRKRSLASQSSDVPAADLVVHRRPKLLLMPQKEKKRILRAVAESALKNEELQNANRAAWALVQAFGDAGDLVIRRVKVQ